MAGTGGKRPGAGRKRGVPNRKSLIAAEALEALGCSPLEGMVRIAEAAEAEGDKALAGRMYSELAQYVAPKRKAVEVAGDGGGPVQITSFVELAFVDAGVSSGS